jgi:putative flippase GtrA
MPRITAAAHEIALAAKYSAASLCGFAVDVAVLHAAMWAGLEPAWARVISLACAMQTTFLINGLHVFGALARDHRLLRQWAAYMASNGTGNLINYWIFVTIVSLHWRIVSVPAAALCAGSATAWAINYLCARFLVFGTLRELVVRLRLLRRLGRRAISPLAADRSPAAPESARR